MGMGYQVNPGRTGNRWQQKVNGVMQNFYELVRPLQPDSPMPMQRSQQQQQNLLSLREVDLRGSSSGRRTDA